MRLCAHSSAVRILKDTKNFSKFAQARGNDVARLRRQADLLKRDISGWLLKMPTPPQDRQFDASGARVPCVWSYRDRSLEKISFFQSSSLKVDPITPNAS